MVAIVATLVPAGCQGLPQATAEPSEQVPGPGFVVITANPPRLSQDITLRLVGPDGQPGEKRDTQRAREILNFNGIDLPGLHILLVNDQPCDGNFAIETDRITTVVLATDGERCHVTMTGIKAVAPG